MRDLKHYIHWYPQGSRGLVCQGYQGMTVTRIKSQSLAPKRAGALEFHPFSSPVKGTYQQLGSAAKPSRNVTPSNEIGTRY